MHQARSNAVRLKPRELPSVREYDIKREYAMVILKGCRTEVDHSSARK